MFPKINAAFHMMQINTKSPCSQILKFVVENEFNMCCIALAVAT